MEHALIMEMPYQVAAPVILKRYKAAFRWVNEKDKGAFKSAEVILPISVGQKYHEEGEFEATMKLINKSFKKCTILIADTLRRHSPDIMALANNEDEAIDIAKFRGAEWFNRNAMYIGSLSIPYKISKWDDWLQHSEYDTYLNLIHHFYNTNTTYRATVHETVAQFLFRGTRQSDTISFSGCVSYVLEESAVACLWAKSGFKFDIYPSGDNKAMMAAYNYFLKGRGYKYRSLQLNIKKI